MNEPATRSFTTDPSAAEASDRIRSFKARQGRISALTSSTLTTLGARYLIAPERAFDAKRAFGHDLPVIVEIGCGFGEATMAMAAREPHTAIVAIDVHTRGVARLMQRLQAESISNVRVVHDDAVAFLTDAVMPGSLAGVRIFFPDPWPKARHHKRRLVQRPFVDMLTARLAPEAVLHMATDWAPYAEKMLSVLTACPGLQNTHEEYAPRPDWRPLTRYESAGLDKGHDVYDLVFVRR